MTPRYLGNKKFWNLHDYIDRTEIREGKGEGERHSINIDALYRQPLVGQTPHTQVSLFNIY